MIETEKDSTWKKGVVPRGKSHNKTEVKTTVSMYLDRKLVERARNHRLNLSRITEQALSSILDYMESQNSEESSAFSLSTGSLFPKRESVVVPRAGFEPATTRSSASPSKAKVFESSALPG